MITALITGIGGTRSIAVINSLRQMKESVRIVGTDANYFNAGSFMCDVSYVVPLASEPTYLTELKRIIEAEKVSIVFATVEKEVSVLAANRAEIQKETGAVVLVPDSEVLRTCFDKYKTQDFLRTHNFTAIPCIYFSNRDEIRKFAKQYGFPLVRKPVLGYGSRGLSILQNQSALDAAEADNAYVLQQYIENDDTESFYNTILNEYTAEVFVNNDLSIAGGIIIKRALHAGETVAGYRVKNQETLEYLSRIATALKIKGPCNFQYRKHDGSIYIFEINPLFSGTTFIRARYGFNNVELAINSFVHGEHRHIAQDSLTNDNYFIRYLQEDFIRPEDVEELKRTKKFEK